MHNFQRDEYGLSMEEIPVAILQPHLPFSHRTPSRIRLSELRVSLK